jgi:hypothetical protein
MMHLAEATVLKELVWRSGYEEMARLFDQPRSFSPAALAPGLWRMHFVYFDATNDVKAAIAREKQIRAGFARRKSR